MEMPSFHYNNGKSYFHDSDLISLMAYGRLDLSCVDIWEVKDYIVEGSLS